MELTFLTYGSPCEYAVENKNTNGFHLCCLFLQTSSQPKSYCHSPQRPRHFTLVERIIWTDSERVGFPSDPGQGHGRADLSAPRLVPLPAPVTVTSRQPAGRRPITNLSTGNGTRWRFRADLLHRTDGQRLSGSDIFRRSQPVPIARTFNKPVELRLHR